MKMNNNGWYSFDDDQVDSYTDFTNGTYTEFGNRGCSDFNGGNYANFNGGNYVDFNDRNSAASDNRNYINFNDRNYVDFGTGYADFTNGTYTDLTEIRTGTPVKKGRGRVRRAEKRSAAKRAAKAEKEAAKAEQKAAKAERKAAKAAKKSVKSKKKGTAGKVIFGVVAASVAVVAGTFLVKGGVVQACTESIIDEYFANIDIKEPAVNKGRKSLEPAFEITDECTSYDKSSPAYEIAEDIMADLWRDNDVDTAYEIFNWVHSNISYQTMTSYESFEEAAYGGFTRRSGDCYVYFACSKMLLDIAGIPNLMVERYPVETNSHFWNLVQIDGLWYHCDATVFRDHPDMYFLCTDYEIDDGHHSFDASLYPERAESYYAGTDNWYGSYDVCIDDSYDSYDDSYYDPYYDCNEDPYYYDDSYAAYEDPYSDYDEPYAGNYGPNAVTDGPYVDYENYENYYDPYEDYEYSYADYEDQFMDVFEDAYAVNYN
jgi:hypothetical protein